MKKHSTVYFKMLNFMYVKYSSIKNTANKQEERHCNQVTFKPPRKSLVGKRVNAGLNERAKAGLVHPCEIRDLRAVSPPPPFNAHKRRRELDTSQGPSNGKVPF